MVEHKYKHEISNLLAILHRDGGHYEDKHGTKQALIDAIPAHYTRIEEEAALTRRLYETN
ncbi:MAG: hypothetical protein DRI65_06630 [Chloroflexota bacterium]|nr:MAG: hypothetical protein DRI65_06630 [Chloroflexota bacterium]